MTLNGLLEQAVELVDPGSDAEVDRLVTEVDDDTTEDGGVDLVNNLQALGILSSLRLLEGSFQTRLGIAWKRARGSDRNGEFALVLGDELVEALNDTDGLVQTAVLRQHREEVFGQVRKWALLGGLRLLEERLEASRAVAGGKSRVVYESVDFGDALDRGLEGVKLALNLVEVGGRLGECSGEDSVRILEGDAARGAAPQAGGYGNGAE